MTSEELLRLGFLLALLGWAFLMGWLCALFGAYRATHEPSPSAGSWPFG
jgi:hypothetical protein